MAAKKPTVKKTEKPFTKLLHNNKSKIIPEGTTNDAFTKPVGTFAGKLNVQEYPLFEKSGRPTAIQVGGSHYKHFPIQPVQFFEANKGKLSFCQEQIIKYTCRLGEKGNTSEEIVAKTREDMNKIRHYLDLFEELHPEIFTGGPKISVG